MSSAALDNINTAQAALDAALEARDLKALEAASAALAQAVEEAAAVGNWPDQPALRAALVQHLQRAESTAGRINGLKDVNRRKLDKLISLAGTPRAVAYQRSGKLG